MATTVRSAITQAIAESREQILAFLDKLVRCNSYSHNKSGVDEMGRLVAREMPRCFSHQVITNTSLGNHHIYSHANGDARPIVLSGHLDTLCPEDKTFNALTQRGDTLVGPGVNDMKGGDVALIWALKILQAVDRLDDLPLVCILSGDEELGSPTSRPLFQAMRDKASLGLVFECGGPAGTVVTTRKGIVRCRLHITGAPSHFGNLAGPKVSAVQELANKVLAIEALNRPDKSVVANAGKVQGGLAANAVAEQASMDFEFRFWDPELETGLRETVNRICNSITVAGCKTRLEQLSYRPPMQPSPAAMGLFRMIVALAAELGQTIVEEKRGGVSDACFLSHAGIPTIDGLGPLGDKDFTKEEYIVTETLFQRIELAANLLLTLKETGLPN